MKLLAVAATLFCLSCQLHLTNTSKTTSLVLPECESASDFSVDLSEVIKLEEKSRLPHVTASAQARYAIEAEILSSTQLGHEDYTLVATGAGHGNQHSDRSSIRKALASRAKLIGAELVVVMEDGTDYSTSAYQAPGTFSGNSYYPGPIYASTHAVPTATYRMFRRIAGEGRFRKFVMTQQPEALVELLSRRNALLNGDSISIADYIKARDLLMSGL
jgi:hypothetical protein